MTDREELETLISIDIHLMNRLNWAVNGGLNTAARRASIGELKSEMRNVRNSLQEATSAIARRQKTQYHLGTL